MAILSCFFAVATLLESAKVPEPTELRASERPHASSEAQSSPALLPLMESDT
jgi:hypothetical protein